MVKRLRKRLAAPEGAHGYGCALCGAHLCLSQDIISRHFHGKHGRAILVDRCANYYYGPQEQKELMTGTHIVRDVFCNCCDKNVGWCYDFAHSEKERYKVQRFVLEHALIRPVSTDQEGGPLCIDETMVLADVSSEESN
ncbi:zinc-binding protein (Yippee) [Strigomonas culicis]|uniref:Protein yippee-like n=2 Tax=Strigomonas culicis TaxID=28005 RepID=S9ULE4_9TRYP|nr:zinc-binding protein (Yippee) [Strigomonas culicis]EPY32242.1 zinc-binding protein (Yippee) [Strigomonas culicis]|eukprot:EPY29564.1 zinc-binding protein (Yippee) [Strigomonas culicis]